MTILNYPVFGECLKRNVISHVLNLNNNIITKSEDKAEALAQYFTNMSSNQNQSALFTQHQNTNPIDIDTEIQNSERLPADQNLNLPFSLNELKIAINQSKNKSAPGEDDIIYE